MNLISCIEMQCCAAGGLFVKCRFENSPSSV